MIGTTLVDVREHAESLASADGESYVVCGRTGDRPVPVSCLRFAGRATAQSAARAAEQYRTALGRYDPQLPCSDPIVRRDTERPLPAPRQHRDDREAAPRALSEPVPDGRSGGPDRP